MLVISAQHDSLKHGRLNGSRSMYNASSRDHGFPESASRSGTPSSSLANFEALLSASRRTSASPGAEDSAGDGIGVDHDIINNSAHWKGKGKALPDRSFSTMPCRTGNTRDNDISSSIIIVGMPGVGKSTLAVIAATYLECPLIDIDRTLAHRFEMPVADFIRRYGDANFRRYESQLLAEVLATLESSRTPPHPAENGQASGIEPRRNTSKQCVIACGGGICDSEENRAQLLLFREKGGTIIHVHRDKHVVVSNLRESTSIVFGTDERRVRDLWHKRMPLYESIASWTFVNTTADSGQTRATSSGLALKMVERDFLAFLKFILAKEPPPLDALQQRSYLATMQSARPFAMTASELANALMGALAVQITPESLDAGFSPPPTPHADRGAMQHMTAAHTVAHLRRHAAIPIVCALGTATTNHLALGRYSDDSLMVSNVLDAFRLATEIVAVDGDIPEDAMAIILNAKPLPVRLMLCYRLDGYGAIDWQVSTVLAKIQHARSRGACLVRIATAPRDPLSFSSILPILHQEDGCVILQATGAYCNSTLLFNKHLTPIGVPSSRPHIGDTLLSFQDTQRALLLSGITYTKDVRVAQRTSIPAEYYSRMEKAIQQLCLPLQLVSTTLASPPESDSSTAGFLAENALSPAILEAEICEASRLTGVYTVARDHPRRYEDAVPIALADTLGRHLSPVNAVTSRSMAIIVGGTGSDLQRAFLALHRMRFKSVYVTNAKEGPACGITAAALPEIQSDAMELLRRSPPTVVIFCTTGAGFATSTALVDAIFASSTGGCAISLEEDRSSHVTSQIEQITKHRPGWNAIKVDNLYSAVMTFEFQFLTAVNMPQLVS